MINHYTSIMRMMFSRMIRLYLDQRNGSLIVGGNHYVIDMKFV